LNRIDAAEAREAVSLIASTDTAKALALARQISDPWYRAQGLAIVARYASEELVSPIVRESLDTAFEQGDPYKVVAVSAWPVRALVERNETALPPSLLSDLAKRSRDIDNPVSQLLALSTLWHGAFSFLRPETDIILEEFVRACESANSWRAGACMEDTVLIVASRDPARATELVQRMPDGKYKRRTLKRLSEKAYLTPRRFFWALT
jgi:hypothetical protein